MVIAYPTDHPVKKATPDSHPGWLLNPPGTHLRAPRVSRRRQRSCSVELLFFGGTGQGLHGGRTAIKNDN